jgi:hypothetical protein
MGNGAEAKAASRGQSQIKNNLKITGTESSTNPNPRNKMTQNKRLTVIAQFEYRNPKTGQPFYTVRGWPCKSQEDAEHTVKYYGHKTGSVEAQCRLEELTDEEVKQITRSIITKEAHQA